MFFGYSLTIKAYKIFNKKSLVIKESIHVMFDDAFPCNVDVDGVYLDTDKFYLDKNGSNNQEK